MARARRWPSGLPPRPLLDGAATSRRRGGQGARTRGCGGSAPVAARRSRALASSHPAGAGPPSGGARACGPRVSHRRWSRPGGEAPSRRPRTKATRPPRGLGRAGPGRSGAPRGRRRVGSPPGAHGLSQALARSAAGAVLAARSPWRLAPADPTCWSREGQLRRLLFPSALGPPRRALGGEPTPRALRVLPRGGGRPSCRLQARGAECSSRPGPPPHGWSSRRRAQAAPPRTCGARGGTPQAHVSPFWRPSTLRFMRMPLGAHGGCVAQERTATWWRPWQRRHTTLTVQRRGARCWPEKPGIDGV